MASRGVEESTWERKDTMRATYPFLFSDFVRGLVV